jgi:Fe-S cluster assembly iron-binding protein IscA
MLAITPNAAEAIGNLVSELPEGSGLRITTEVRDDEAGGSRTDLRLSLTDSPAEGDQVLEGAHVFVESDTAELLDDKLLDADVGGGEIQFSLRQQAA